MFLIGGFTGSGKTALLHALRARGEQAVDLEALARHHGSAFGATSQQQPRHRTFVRSVRAALASAGDRVWLEDEGPFIGSVGLPPELYASFATTPVIWLEAPRDLRIQRLVATYGGRPDLLDALARIAPRLGLARTTTVHAALASADLPTAAATLLDYYDDAYRHRVSSWPRPILAHADATTPNALESIIALCAPYGSGCTNCHTSVDGSNHPPGVKLTR